MKKIRTKLIIFPEFQLTLILMMVAINFLTLFVIAYFVRGEFQALWDASQASGMTESSPFYRFIQDLQLGVFKKAVLGFTIGTVISAVLALRISLKFAGPLYRLRTYFETVKTEGSRKGPIKFRKGDYLYTLGDTIEEALQKIETTSNSKLT